MPSWKLTEALKSVFDPNFNTAAPILVTRPVAPRPTPGDGIIEALFPTGRRTPVQKVQDLSAACQLARRILEEVGQRLDRELDRTRTALERLPEPTAEVAQRPFELTCQGLEEHWGALELIDAALAGEDVLDQAVELARQADASFDQAERAARSAVLA